MTLSRNSSVSLYGFSRRFRDYSISLALLLRWIQTMNFSLLRLLSGSISLQQIRTFNISETAHTTFYIFMNQRLCFSSSNFKRQLQFNEQRISMKSQILQPMVVREIAQINKGEAIKRLSGESASSIDINKFKECTHSAKEIENNSNLTIVNKVLSENSYRIGKDANEESLRTVLAKKEQEIQYFRKEVEKLRSEYKNQQNQKLLEHQKKQEVLERQKQILMERMARVQQELETFQSQLGGSNINLELSSSSSRGIPQDVIIRDNQTLQQFKIQAEIFKKQYQQKVDQLQSYRAQVVLEIGLLTKINQVLDNQNKNLRQTNFQLQDLLKSKQIQPSSKQSDGESVLNTEKGREQERLVKIANQLEQVRIKLAQKDKVINSLRKQLRDKQEQLVVPSRDFIKISSQTQLIKTQIILKTLSSEIETLRNENEDLRLKYQTQKQQNSDSLRKLNKQHQGKKQKICQLQSLLQIQKIKSKQLRQSFSKVQQVEAEYNEQLKSKQSQLLNAQVQLTKAQTKIFKLQNESNNKNSQTVFNLKKQKDQFCTRINELQQQNHLIKQKIQSQQEKLNIFLQKQQSYKQIELYLMKFLKLGSSCVTEINSNLLFNKLINIFEDLQNQLVRLKKICEQLQSQVYLTQVQNQNLLFEKKYMINQMESMIKRIKEFEEHSNYLASILQQSQSKKNRLKQMNSNLKVKLEKQITEKLELKNRVRGEIFQKGHKIEKLKLQKSDVFINIKN